MSSSTPYPPLVNIYESKAPQCYAAAIATYIIAVIAVALRFWARKLMKAGIWVDDWTAAVALVGYPNRHTDFVLLRALILFLLGARYWVFYWDNYL